MLRHIFSGKVVAALLAAVTLLLPSTATAAVLPTGFTDSFVGSVLQPTALAFTPDGRLLVTSQAGTLQVIQDGTVLPTPALSLTSGICADGERGLLGVATDPGFEANHFIYLYYTAATASGCVNHVSRFVLSDGNIVDPTSEEILLNIPSPTENHNGGDVHFGHDAYLYVTVGDGGAFGSSRDLNVVLGKILRITSDGGIPADNPFLGTDSARCNISGSTDPGKVCQEIFAWGLRNPFRIAFDPNTSDTRFYINDVGEQTWEEIDVGQAGADYGWNIREGFCAIGSTTDCGPPPAGMTNPIYAYGHTDGCTSITAGAFVPNGVWPATYDGSYLFGDYRCAKIWQLTPSGLGFTATEFATDLGVGGPIMMTFGPAGATQALYYTTYAFGIGEVRRIDFTQPQQENHPPTAALAADVTSGPAPLSVQFDASGSTDPDAGDTLTYIWDFGDGTTGVETTGATVSHVYSNAGTFTAALTVRDNHGASSTPATVEINVASALTLPENVGLPEVHGIPRVGNTLSATTGTWTGSEPLEFTYQWLRCATDGSACAPITGATGATYALVAADFGSSIRVAVTAANGAGAALATSAATPRVKHECSGAPCT
jgi:glucose/arabinose dehydrogenase/PKD repeat protein